MPADVYSELSIDFLPCLFTLHPLAQDNWFVLCAVLKDQFGVLMEEESGGRPSCPACRRTHLAVMLRKIV